MKKELPRVYGLNVDHDTNSKMSYNKFEEEKKERFVYETTVPQKIKEIFNSVNYIYKVDVIIETKEGSFKKRIIGRTNNYLITIDNERIAIDDIIDIYIK